MFSYFGLSSLFIIQQMHFSVVIYGIFVALNALPILAMSALTPRFAKKISLQKIMQYGLYLIFLGGFCMWFLNIYFAENITIFLVPMFVITTGIGLIRPSASASALGAADKRVAGFASAFSNFIAFISGSVATALSSQLIQHISGFGVFACCSGAIALTILWGFQAQYRKLGRA